MVHFYLVNHHYYLCFILAPLQPISDGEDADSEHESDDTVDSVTDFGTVYSDDDDTVYSEHNFAYLSDDEVVLGDTDREEFNYALNADSDTRSGEPDSEYFPSDLVTVTE